MEHITILANRKAYSKTLGCLPKEVKFFDELPLTTQKELLFEVGPNSVSRVYNSKLLSYTALAFGETVVNFGGYHIIHKIS